MPPDDSGPAFAPPPACIIEPRDQRQWNRVRSLAAIMAEAGILLETRVPPRGTHAAWVEQTKAFTSAADTVVAAADQHDYAAAQRGLTAIAARCAACHADHR